MRKDTVPFDPATADLEGVRDPILDPVTPTEDASPEEEEALAKATVAFREFAFSDKGLQVIIDMLTVKDMELFETIAEAAAPILQKVHADMPDLPGSVYFGDGGLLQQAVSSIWDIAVQQGVPGSDDEEQRDAALINLYKMAGEYILESGDQDSVDEAILLGKTMALTNKDGTMSSPRKFRKKHGAGEPNPQVSEAVHQGLLG